MPVYCYACQNCRRVVELLRPMKDSSKLPVCPDCKVRMERNLSLETTNGHPDYLHEILSDRMGVAPSQVAEHRRLYPNIPMNKEGQMVIKNTTEERNINRQLAKVFNKPV